MLTFILGIVLFGFLEMMYHIPCMTCNVTEAYEGEPPSNAILYEFKHITKNGGMCVIQVSCSQPGWFGGSKVERNTTNRDNRMGYMTPFIPLMVTAACTILNHTPIDSVSLLAS